MALAAFSTHDIDEAIFHVANVLRVPVLVLALLALALVIYEVGGYVVEVRGRRKRQFAGLRRGTAAARAALLAGNRTAAAHALTSEAPSAAMRDTLSFIVEHAQTPGSEHELNKAL